MNRSPFFIGLLALLQTSVAPSQVPEDGLTSRELGIRREAPVSPAVLLARGEEIYTYWCQPCHGAETIKPGTAALAAKYQGTIPAPLAARSDLTPEFVKLMVRQGISMMPFFRPTEISDADLDALAAYLASGPNAQ
jgi:mono/diheme cytochrome c family protein